MCQRNVLKLFMAAAASGSGGSCTCSFLVFRPIMLRSDPTENAAEARVSAARRRVKTVLERQRSDTEASFRCSFYTSWNAQTRAIAPLRRSPPDERQIKANPCQTSKPYVKQNKAPLGPTPLRRRYPWTAGPERRAPSANATHN